MSVPVSLLSRLFLTPAVSQDGAVVSVEAVLPPAVAVVGRDRRAVAAGCGAGLVLARRCRAPAALVCVRGGAGAVGWRAAPAFGARRLAGLVGAGGGVPVVAAGRLVLVDLDAPSADEALAQAEQAMGLAGDAPTVLVLAGPREAQFDRLLGAQDAVAVAGSPGDAPELAELALSRLPAGAVSLGAQFPALASLLAAGGLTVLPALGRVVAPLIEAAG